MRVKSFFNKKNVQFLYTIDVERLFNSTSISSKRFPNPGFVTGIYYYKNSILAKTVDDYTSSNTKYECLNTVDTSTGIYK